MLKLDDIGLVLENFRLIFFDFGLKLGEGGITMAETVFIHFSCIYIHVRTWAHIVAISKKEATPTTPKYFLSVWPVSEVGGRRGRGGHLFSQYNNYRVFA